MILHSTVLGGCNFFANVHIRIAKTLLSSAKLLIFCSYYLLQGADKVLDPPYNTKYGLFLIILCKSYEKSHIF